MQRGECSFILKTHTQMFSALLISVFYDLVFNFLTIMILPDILYISNSPAYLSYLYLIIYFSWWEFLPSLLIFFFHAHLAFFSFCFLFLFPPCTLVFHHHCSLPLVRRAPRGVRWGYIRHGSRQENRGIWYRFRKAKSTCRRHWLRRALNGLQTNWKNWEDLDSERND